MVQIGVDTVHPSMFQHAGNENFDERACAGLRILPAEQAHPHNSDRRDGTNHFGRLAPVVPDGNFALGRGLGFALLTHCVSQALVGGCARQFNFVWDEKVGKGGLTPFGSN
jgi:hypothetical protein